MFIESSKDRGRLKGSMIYFIAGILLIYIPLKTGMRLFYNEPINNFYNYPRFLWCLAFSFIGFSCIAYRASKKLHPGSPASSSYPSIYLVTLVLISCLVFGVLHTIGNTNNYLFYYFSAAVCFILGYYIDLLLHINPLDFLNFKK